MPAYKFNVTVPDVTVPIGTTVPGKLPAAGGVVLRVKISYESSLKVRPGWADHVGLGAGDGQEIGRRILDVRVDQAVQA